VNLQLGCCSNWNCNPGTFPSFDKTPFHQPGSFPFDTLLEKGSSLSQPLCRGIAGWSLSLFGSCMCRYQLDSAMPLSPYITHPSQAWSLKMGSLLPTKHMHFKWIFPPKRVILWENFCNGKMEFEQGSNSTPGVAFHQQGL
jgi:hypothetical protein